MQSLNDARDATCTSDGYTGGKQCSNSGCSVVQNGNTIPAKGHRSTTDASGNEYCPDWGEYQSAKALVCQMDADAGLNALYFVKDLNIYQVGKNFYDEKIIAIYNGFEESEERCDMWANYSSSIASVSFVNKLAPRNTSYWFNGFNKITTIDNINNLNTNSVADMSNMFYGCSSLTSLDLSTFSTNNVENMSYMFQDCSQLTQLDVSKWDTSKVTNMRYMFNSCSQLTQLDLGNWDTSNVTRMDDMFYGSSKLTQLDVSKWDMSSVTNMTHMFNDCPNLSTIFLNQCSKNTVDMISDKLTSSCTAYISRGITPEPRNNVTFDYYEEIALEYDIDVLQGYKDTHDEFTKHRGKWYLKKVCNSIHLKEYELLSTGARAIAVQFEVEPFKKGRILTSSFDLGNYMETQNDNIHWYNQGDKLIVYFDKQDFFAIESIIKSQGIQLLVELEEPQYFRVKDPTLFLYKDNYNLRCNSQIKPNIVIRNTSYSTFVKPNTIYTVLCYGDTEGLSYELDGRVYTSNVFKTPSELKDNELRVYGKGKIISQVMVIEGDLSAKQRPDYFKGIQSLSNGDNVYLHYSDSIIFNKGGQDK
jgi:surface protein